MFATGRQFPLAPSDHLNKYSHLYDKLVHSFINIIIIKMKISLYIYLGGQKAEKINHIVFYFFFLGAGFFGWLSRFFGWLSRFFCIVRFDQN